MKKIFLLFALVLTSALYETTNAQVGINVNIESQPVWGPEGYDYAEYYYFPDMDVYYHVPDRQFIFNDGRSWVSDYSLPAFYNRYDLYNSYKVVINEPRPFLRAGFWRSRYSSYRGRPQTIIYRSHNPRYFVINGHPEHQRWVEGRYNNSVRYNGNRPGNYGRTDDRRFQDRRFENNQRPYNGRNDGNRYDNRVRDNNDRRGYGNDRMGGRRF